MQKAEYNHTYFGTDFAVNTERAIEIIDEAEAKWEADCCEWKYDEEEDYYETSCGHLQIIMGGTPTENGYRFCPYCGRKIAEVE
jgi:hypothetical protein